jgi:hypothetical protein
MGPESSVDIDKNIVGGLFQKGARENEFAVKQILGMEDG